MNEKHRTGPGPDDIVNSALELLGARAWPGPERNTRIEEHIMSVVNADRARMTKRKLWIGGLLLLLGGTAIGAVTTSLVTYRFTGVGVDSQGNRYNLEGEMQVEETGDQKQIYMSVDGLPSEGALQSGELILEDGRKVTIVPATEGMTVTLPADGSADQGPSGQPAQPGGVPAAKPEKK